MPDTANQNTSTPVNDGVKKGVALVAVAGAHTDLDQFMKRERCFEFAEHVRGQAVVGNGDDWFARMRQPAQVFFLLFSEFHGSVPFSGRRSVARPKRPAVTPRG